MIEKPIATLKTKPGAVREPANAPYQGANAGDAAALGRDGLPMLGLFAVIFGVLGIFTFAPLFVPLSLILGLICLFVRQVGWGISALLLSVVGFLTSPTLLTIAGLAGVATWLATFI